MREGPKGTGPCYLVLIRKGLKDTAAQPALVVSAGLYTRAVLCMKKELIQKIIITEGPFTSARNKKKKKSIDRILLCKMRSYNCLVHWVWKMHTMLSLKCISMYVEVQN